MADAAARHAGPIRSQSTSVPNPSSKLPQLTTKRRVASRGWCRFGRSWDQSAHDCVVQGRGDVGRYADVEVHAHREASTVEPSADQDDCCGPRWILGEQRQLRVAPLIDPVARQEHGTSVR